MTVLDNLMLGRHIHMRTGVLTAMLRFGPARVRKWLIASSWRTSSNFLKSKRCGNALWGHCPMVCKSVELGRALAAQPRILLLDEPMGGMNVEEKEDMARFILDVNEEWGTTIVLIEHDMGS